MEALQRFVYAIALAFFQAYFDVLRAHQEATDEVVTDKAQARAARFRDAVQRLRERGKAGDP